MDFRDFYKMPLRVCDYCEAYIFTEDGYIAAMSPSIDGNFNEEFADSVVGVINEEIPAQLVKGLSGRKFVYNKNGATVDDAETGKLFIRIRGWGRLTGVGGYHLNKQAAKEIQDSFGEFIVEQLNKTY